MAEKKPRGRPEYSPTEEEREKVRVLKAGGMSREAIAEAIEKHDGLLFLNNGSRR